MMPFPRGFAAQAWRARVAVARKLALVPYRVRTDETEFGFGKEPCRNTYLKMTLGGKS
jgi:hypothetical protein